MRKVNPMVLVCFFTVVLLATIPIGACFGDIKIPIREVWHAFLQPKDSIDSQIIWEYRLPRVVAGLFVGANLAVSGALLQAITQNPLAAPNVVGITAGASLFAVLSMLIFPHFPISGLPVVAFVGAALAGLAVYLLAWKNGVSKGRFALSGIALDALFQAATTGILVLHSKGVDAAIVWLAGSLWGRTWDHVQMIIPWSAAGLLLAFACYAKLNVLQFQDEIATGLGVGVQKNRFLILIIAIALCGSAVAVSGPIGFVGLVIPHLTRLLVGANYQWVLPISAILGAILVISADTLGRTVLAPIEIPVGILTALLGAPYFLFLLRKSSV